MDVASGWSLFRLGKSGAQVLTGGNPLELAIGTALYVKKLMGSNNAEVLDNARKREGCPHLIMIECSGPPYASGSQYVGQNGGVAWLIGSTSYWFWHKEKTFKPLIFERLLFQGPRGVDGVFTTEDYRRAVPQPPNGYGCSECQEAQKSRNR